MPQQLSCLQPLLLLLLVFVRVYHQQQGLVQVALACHQPCLQLTQRPALHAAAAADPGPQKSPAADCQQLRAWLL